MQTGLSRSLRRAVLCGWMMALAVPGLWLGAQDVEPPYDLGFETNGFEPFPESSLTNTASRAARIQLTLDGPSDADAITAGAKRKITLEEAINLTLSQNPDVLQSMAEIGRLAGVVVEARAQALPQLALIGEVSQTDEYLQSSASGAAGASAPVALPAVPGTPDAPRVSVPPNRDQPSNEQWNIELRLSKNVYDGGATRASIKQAKLLEEAAVLQMQEVVLEAIEATRKAFYQVLVNRERIAVEQQNVLLLGRGLADQQRRFDVGVVPRFNVLRAEVEVANARPRLIRSKNAFRVALQQLAKLMAVDYDETRGDRFSAFDVVGKLDAPLRKFDLAGDIRFALNHRPELARLFKVVEAERAGITIARSGYLPRLDVYVSYGFQHERFTDDLDVNDGGYVAGVQGQWNIFDGLATKGRMDQARAQTEIAELSREDARRQVELDVRTAHSDISEAIELIESQQKNTALGLESLRLAVARFESGEGTQLEVLDANVALLEARLEELLSRFSYRNALADLDRATGRDAVFALGGDHGGVFVRPVNGLAK